MQPEELEYVGFWPRVGAALIDTLLVLFITVPLATALHGKQYWLSSAGILGLADFLTNWVLPAIAVVLFWVHRQATPGKIAISARIVDAETGEKPSTGQLIGRYFAYYVSIIPFMAGLLWVAFDARKQGWHDKLAGTVVVRPKQRGRPAALPCPDQVPAAPRDSRARCSASSAVICWTVARSRAGPTGGRCLPPVG